MTCRFRGIGLSAFVDGELSRTEERALRDHLPGCRACREEVSRLRELTGVLTAWDRENSAGSGDGFVERVVARTLRSPRQKTAGPHLSRVRTPLRRWAAAAVLLLFAGFASALLLDAARVPSPERRDAADLPVEEAGPRSPESIAPPDLAPSAVAVAPLPEGGPPLPASPRDLPSIVDPEPRPRLTRRFGRDLTPGAIQRLLAYRFREEQLHRRELLAREEAPEPRAGGDVVVARLAGLSPGPFVKIGALEVVPLSAAADETGIEAISLPAALEEGILTLEEDEAGMVALSARNRDRARYVYLAPGDLIVGGFQDRVVYRPALLRPNSQDLVPVLCAERERMTGPSDRFLLSPGVAPPSIRQALLAGEGQDRVWALIREHLAAVGAENETEALREGYLVAHAEGTMSLPEELSGSRVVGFLVFAGGRFLGGDVFSTSGLLADRGPGLLAGYRLEAEREAGNPVSPVSPEAVLAALRGAQRLAMTATVGGRELEYRGGDLGIVAVALVAIEGRGPIHISLLPGSGKSFPRAEEPTDESTEPGDEEAEDETSSGLREEPLPERVERRREQRRSGGRREIVPPGRERENSGRPFPR